MLPQQPGRVYLKLIAGPHDAQEGFLLGRLEGALLLEFVLQLRGRHGSIRAVRSPANSLYVIYRQVKSLAGVFLPCVRQHAGGSGCPKLPHPSDYRIVVVTKSSSFRSNMLATGAIRSSLNWPNSEEGLSYSRQVLPRSSS